MDYSQGLELCSGMDAIMEHGGITALLVLLNNGHLEAWSSATHTLHMLCSSTPAAAVIITQSGTPHCRLDRAATCAKPKGMSDDTECVVDWAL